MATANPTIELIPCLVIPQGRWADVSGQPLAEVLAQMMEHGAAFLRQYPSGAKFYRPSWHTSARRADEGPRLGHELYDINLDGTLGPRVTNWDSGD